MRSVSDDLGNAVSRAVVCECSQKSDNLKLLAQGPCGAIKEVSGCRSVISGSWLEVKQLLR